MHPAFFIPPAALSQLRREYGRQRRGGSDIRRTKRVADSDFRVTPMFSQRSMDEFDARSAGCSTHFAQFIFMVLYTYFDANEAVL